MSDFGRSTLYVFDSRKQGQLKIVSSAIMKSTDEWFTSRHGFNFIDKNYIRSKGL